jgi:hypothetical protein
MKGFIVILAAVVALASATTAAATSWTWTETRAEAWVTTYPHVSVFDQDSWNAHQDDISTARYEAERCKDPAWAARDPWCPYADADLQKLIAAPRSIYYAGAVRADCRGASPSRDAYHFWRFRCRVWFDRMGWGDVRVTVTGRRTAVWRWLP